jgi:hypothetical protein
MLILLSLPALWQKVSYPIEMALAGLTAQSATANQGNSRFCIVNQGVG